MIRTRASNSTAACNGNRMRPESHRGDRKLWEFVYLPALNIAATPFEHNSKDLEWLGVRKDTGGEGRSIDLVDARFRDHTTALFKKHGMTIIGYWQPVTKRNTLIYILAYKDGAARDAAWAAFGADPEWVKTR